MNLTSLQPLANRWPADQLVLPAKDGLFIDTADSQLLANFAADNGWTYQASSDFAINRYGTVPPAWLGSRGGGLASPLFAHVISGRLAGYSFEACLAYTPPVLWAGRRPATSDAATQIPLQRRGIVRVTLPKLFPQLVLDSNKNDQGADSSLPASFAAKQKLSLEGDFARHYDFYAPLGLQVHSLTVLAPNFMQLLIDAAPHFDVEIYGNELVMVTRDQLYSPQVMQAAIEALTVQLKYFDRLLVSWNYQPRRLPFDILERTYFDGTVIKLGRLRLSPAIVLLLCLTGFIVFGILIVVAPE